MYTQSEKSTKIGTIATIGFYTFVLPLLGCQMATNNSVHMRPHHPSNMLISEVHAKKACVKTDATDDVRHRPYCLQVKSVKEVESIGHNGQKVKKLLVTLIVSD